jgi:hypothetical protein
MMSNPKSSSHLLHEYNAASTPLRSKHVSTSYTRLASSKQQTGHFVNLPCTHPMTTNNEHRTISPRTAVYILTRTIVQHICRSRWNLHSTATNDLSTTHLADDAVTTFSKSVSLLHLQSDQPFMRELAMSERGLPCRL